MTHVHEWGEPEYVWKDDNTEVTATRVCTIDPTDIETETVDTTPETIVEPDCVNPGKTVYTAKFENEAFGTKTKEVAEPAALDHELSLVEYKEPTEDEPGNIAYYVCGRCGKFFEDEKGEIEIVDHDSVIIPKLNPVPDTGNNNVMLELAVAMMAVSAAGAALYVNAERQRREEE